MFGTSIFSQPRVGQNQDEPFGSELFQMMAASTAGLAFGGPNRMLFKQSKTRTPSTKTETPAPPPASAEGEVRGWFQYDPETEAFRQSSVDERNEEEEQIAAQTLVDLCEQTMSAKSMTTTCCHYEEQDAGLLRASFSFGIRKEPFASSPSASPFSGGYGKARQITPISMLSDVGCDGVSAQKGNTNSTALSVDIGDEFSRTLSSTSSSSSIITGNRINHDTSSLKFLPPLRETRLNSHRGSFMEAGVVLDSRIFGGICVVQEGRKVGVRRRRSEGGFRLGASVPGLQ